MAHTVVEVTAVPDRAVREAADMGTLAALMNRATLAAIHAKRGSLTEEDRQVLLRVASTLRVAAEGGHSPVDTHDGWSMSHSTGAGSLPVPGADDHEPSPELEEAAEAVDAVLADQATEQQHVVLRAHLARLASAGKAASDHASRSTAPLELAWSAT